MTMASSGPISMAMVATELGISASGLSMGDGRCRTLAGKPSGPISMSDFYGKSTSTGTIVIGQAPGYNIRGYSKPGFGFPAFGGMTSKPVSGSYVETMYFDYTQGLFGNMYTINMSGNLSGRKLRFVCAGLDIIIPFVSLGTTEGGAQVSMFMGSGTDVFSPRLGQSVPFTLTLV